MELAAELDGADADGVGVEEYGRAEGDRGRGRVVDGSWKAEFRKLGRVGERLLSVLCVEEHTWIRELGGSVFRRDHKCWLFCAFGAGFDVY